MSDFNKWVAEKAGVKYHDKPYFVWDSDKSQIEYPPTEITLEILIKAMWAINRRGYWCVEMFKDAIGICNKEPGYDDIKEFKYKDHNNSEMEALKAALEYIQTIGG